MSLLEAFRRDQRGSIAVVAALTSTMLFAATALAIDLGSAIVARKQAQGAVDVAAMVAASNIAAAESTAGLSLADNGYGAASVVTVQTGTYAADPGIPVAERFVPGRTPANAVRVGLRGSTPTYFAQAFGFGSSVDIAAQGTAAAANFGAFSIGSGLISLDAGVTNAILGGMLGTSVSLSLVDYNALAGARIDAFKFLDALNTGADLRLGSYADILRANATIGQVVNALVTAGSGQAYAALSPLGQIAAVLHGGGGSLNLGKLISLGDSGALSPSLGSSGPAASLLDLLTAAIVLSNGTRQIGVDLGVNVPGLLRTRMTIAVGERRQSSGYVAPGTGTSVSTAQTRVLIEAGVTLPLGLGAVTLPIYVEAASARASLGTVTCPWTERDTRQMALDVRTGLAELAVAEVPKSLVTPGGPRPDLGNPATLLQLTPLFQLQGRARATLGSASPQSLTFTADEIARSAVRSVSSTGLTQSAVGTLLQSLTLSYNGIGLAPVLLTATLTTTLSTVTPLLDAILDSTLRTLGIRIGIADVTPDGVLCAQAVLVQ